MSQNSDQTPDAPSEPVTPATVAAQVAPQPPAGAPGPEEPASAEPDAGTGEPDASAGGSEPTEAQPAAQASSAANADPDATSPDPGPEASSTESGSTGSAGGATSAQHVVADGLRTVGEKVSALAEGDGVVSGLAGKAAAGLNQASSWVADSDPEAMLTQAKSMARRKPWVAAAGVIGLLMVARRITGGKKHKKG
ncbi:hypothetical protein [Microbacterium sp. NPDC096154]|uniref:hypothetical protein n=1 Tax=Microbacterium sp. NPDC096154 TaxID=3155549 RepID=UPI003322277A